MDGEPRLSVDGHASEFKFSTSALRTFLKGVLAQVHPDMGLPLSDNFVASFNCMLSKLIGKVVREISGAAGADDAFERAVDVAVSGELSKHANTQVKKALEQWVKTGGVGEDYSVDAHKELGALGLTDADTVRLVGLCDYTIAEHLELAGNAQRDDKYRSAVRHA